MDCVHLWQRLRNDENISLTLTILTWYASPRPGAEILTRQSASVQAGGTTTVTWLKWAAAPSSAPATASTPLASVIIS